VIVIDNIYKSYKTSNGKIKNVLSNVSFTIPPKVSVGLVGANGAGKSTLLRIIGGIERPDKGSIQRHSRVSWPMGFSGGLQPTLTGRQNAKFVCRIHGHEDNIPERLKYIQDFSGIGEAFDRPVKTYSAGMKSRLQFGMSLAFDFDVYISDEVTAVGDAAFKKKAADAFKKVANHASILMVSHSDSILKQFCSAGMFIYQGKVHWFDQLDDALAAYKDTMPK